MVFKGKGNMEVNDVRKIEESVKFLYFENCFEILYGIIFMLFVFKY